MFDEDTARQQEREKRLKISDAVPSACDWTRDDVYARGRSR